MRAPTAAPARLLDAAALAAWPLPQPAPDGDKEARGRVVLVAGSREIPGAALLAAEAALRAGAGKVLIATAASVAQPLALALPEARVMGLPELPGGGIDPAAAALLAGPAAQAGALLVGPGMVDEDATEALVLRLRAGLRHSGAATPMVLDAVAMRAACRAVADGIDPAGAAPVLLTPHAGEMAHLTGLDKDAVLADAAACAQETARRWRAVVALKGSSTFVADPQGALWRHDGGSIGLATAGSGDVLAGLVSALVARGAGLLQAAAWGVVLHGLAGQALAGEQGTLGFLARELPARIPRLLEQLGPPPGPGARNGRAAAHPPAR